jgi:hypothetical protein
VGVEVMAEKTAWKAARVGSWEAAKVVGSETRGRRSGLRERAGRLSMTILFFCVANCCLPDAAATVVAC